MKWRSRVAAVLAALCSGGLSVAVASGAWSSSQSAGPMTLSAATVAPPVGLSTTNNCVRGAHNWVILRWTANASGFAGGYEILRATGASQPVSIGTVSGLATVIYRDKTVAFTTSYSYAVQTSYGAWRSVDSNAAAITTLNNRCR